MGATNNLKESNITLKLVDLVCPECEEKFTKQEIDNGNYDLWFDTTNDVQLEPIVGSAIERHHYYFPTNRKGYYFSIWIRSIEHKDCLNIINEKHE